jgi:O-antigen ligase
VRGYGFGGYDDDNSYVYSHSVATLRRKPLDLNNILGILSLAGFLGTALFALLQSRNGIRLHNK